MRLVFLVIFMAIMATGCVTRFDETSVSVLWGDSMIGEDCTVYGDEIECESVIKGAELGGAAGEVIGRIIDTTVSVAGKFVPGGLDSGDPDTLDVRLVEDE